MKIQNCFRIECCLLLIAVVTLTGCKKHVAAAPPVQPVQPSIAPPAPTITLSAAPGSIDRGQTTALRWEARNASAVRIEPELGSVQNEGTRSVNPASSVTYMATATGPGGSATDSARVTVRIPAAAAPASPEPRADARVSVDELFKQNMKSIYFDYDKAEVRPDQVAPLQANIAWLKSHPGFKFTIEGNGDERGSEEYNLGLGDRRANVVKDFLIKEGIDPSSIRTISYGEERPVCREPTESCYQRNRSAAFVPGPTS
jgi:peptidoglycan-associated lipoprotein